MTVTDTSGVPPPAPAADTPAPARRAPPGELVSGASALLLLLLMFAAEWFGVNRLPGQASGVQRSTAENAWQGLPVLRWLMLATIVVSVGSVILHASQQTHGARNNSGGLIVLLGGTTAALLVYRVLIDLPDAKQVVDQKLGAILGMLSATAIALGGYRTLHEERAAAGREPRTIRRKTRVARAAGPR